MKTRFGFGLNEIHCEAEMFNTVDDLLMYAQRQWDNSDVPFEDCDKHILFVGTIEHHTPFDFAPSLDDIADEITDSFYCEHNIDDDADTQINEKLVAEEKWKEFVNKYFELPYSLTTQWFGEYDLVEHKWVKKYADFNKYVKE